MAFSRRDLARAKAEARRNMSTRFRAHIENTSVNGPATVTPDSLSPPQSLDATKDKLVTGIGVFEESKDSLQVEDTGSARTRKGTIECSARYEQTFRAAYEVEIGGQKGSWSVKGVVTEATGTSIIVYVEARQ